MHYVRLLVSLAILPTLAAFANDVPGRESPGLYIERNQDQLTIQGAVSSEGHEQILRRTAARLFSNNDLLIDVRIANDLPPTWSLITDLTLRALSETLSSNAAITPVEISLRGFAVDATGWTSALQRIQKSLPSEMTLQSSITAVIENQSLNSLCRQLFAAAFRARRIRFKTGSTVLSGGANGLLDELTELSTDCPAAVIDISGSGDGGPGSQQLGKLRADRVLAYLTQRGLNPARLNARGAQSAAHRRIVFSVRFRQ